MGNDAVDDAAHEVDDLDQEVPHAGGEVPCAGAVKTGDGSSSLFKTRNRPLSLPSSLSKTRNRPLSFPPLSLSVFSVGSGRGPGSVSRRRYW